jgi:hypothetical protein
MTIKKRTVSLSQKGSLKRRHEIHHNDIQHNDTQNNETQHNDTQHKGLICGTQHNSVTI